MILGHGCTPVWSRRRRVWVSRTLVPITAQVQSPARPDPEPVRVPPGPAAMEHVVFGPDGMLL